MNRRALAAAAGLAVLAVATTALAQNVSEKVRKINLYTWPQANLPQAYQASQLIAQQWRQLGLEIDVKPLQRQAQTALIWYSRDKWDATMWRMVGRPERSDPDEFLYSLFHSSYAEKGYDFIGYVNPEYDRLAEKQRTQLDREERRKTVFEMQKMIDRDQPYAFLVHPKYPLAFNRAVFKEDTVVNQTGIGIRNIWTFVNIEPIGAQKDLIINSSEPINATNPLYIGGAVDSWITDLIWDRLMRIGRRHHARHQAAARHELARRQAGDDRGRDLLVPGAGRRQGADVQAVRQRDRRHGEDRRPQPAHEAQAA
jgi:peptide/nickel transport system substrate-binding protein